jgi:hypothetical protein
MPLIPPICGKPFVDHDLASFASCACKTLKTSLAICFEEERPRRVKLSPLAKKAISEVRCDAVENTPQSCYYIID